MKFLKKLMRFILANIESKLMELRLDEKKDRCFWCVWCNPYIENNIHDIENQICLCYKNIDNKLTREINSNYKCKWHRSWPEQI